MPNLQDPPTTLITNNLYSDVVIDVSRIYVPKLLLAKLLRNVSVAIIVVTTNVVTTRERRMDVIVNEAIWAASSRATFASMVLEQIDLCIPCIVVGGWQVILVDHRSEPHGKPRRASAAASHRVVDTWSTVASRLDIQLDASSQIQIDRVAVRAQHAHALVEELLIEQGDCVTIHILDESEAIRCF